MLITFTFTLSQQQTFELRCDYGSRPLDKSELLALIDQCEQNYYSKESDRLSYLTEIGRQLYFWLDGKEGWLRNALDETDEQRIYLDLSQISEAQGLNPETERVALGLAHLPWELLCDRTGFILERQDIAVLPVRSVQQRNTKEVKQEVHEQRIITIADGNSRLLKWLLDVVNKPGLAGDELLTKLEGTQQEFRENILAETLLKALNEDERKFLARLSVFHLPVTEDVVRAATSPPGAGGGVRLLLDKLVSLSLVESATTYTSQTATYRVATILELLLQPILSEAEWQRTRQQATRKVYQVWWEESEESTEAERLEIVRLGLLADEQEIAVSVGDVVATSWVNAFRLIEAMQLCQQLMQYADYRILGTIARAEVVLGRFEDALAHYQQALDLCPEEDDIRKAATLHAMAGLIAQNGDIDGAIALYHQSLQIKERINDVKGKAATLSNMAGLIAQNGDIDGAITLYHQSLEINERINNVQGKAATLSNMAYLISQSGDIDGAIALYQESLEIEERINDVKGKAATLHQMAGLIAQSGDIDGAIALYQQSLEIEERINNVQGKAATLHQMAGLIAQSGDIDGAIALYQQSLEIKERIHDVQGKAATLHAIAGLIAQSGDIDGAIALYHQSLEIKERIHDVQGKAATLHAIAGLIAQNGDIDGAIALYHQSLEIKERIHDVQGKAATLHAMAYLTAQNGDINGAIALYHQSLEINERINNVQGKAATLHAMAGLTAQNGDIDGAIALYQQSLEIKERINNVQGKAATLASMAYLAGETGDKVRQLDLNLQAASALAQIRAYIDLVTVLVNLGVADKSNGLVYLAQATWLIIKIQTPLTKTIQLIRDLYDAVPQGDEMEALLGATAVFFCYQRGKNHPQLEEFQKGSLNMISAAADAQGIETQEAFDTWFVQQRLNDPEYYIPRLLQRLEEIVGDEWLFERF
jgi:tetratricopeptide (TPR) repeat protein